MKKSFYLAALALVALSSCSSDDIVVEKNVSDVSGDRVPVVLGVGSPKMTVTTRGTGTIGGTTVETNHWYGERLRVLMTQIPDETYPNFCFTYRTDNETTTELFNNSFYCLPDESDANVNGAARLNLVGVDTRYYPASGNSNFFAYYIDDAINENEGVEETLSDGDIAPLVKDATTDDGMAYKYVDFLLDGSQDVMAGMAPHQEGYEGFSAKSARHNVHPQIAMEHLLTRLTFSVVAGNKNANGVVVKDIAVKSSNAGQLMVAYDASEPMAANSLIKWDEEAEAVDFHLKERAKDTDGNPIYLAEGEKTPLQDMTPYTFEVAPEYRYTTDTPAVPVGDAIFVRPGESSYALTVTTSYPQEGYDDSSVPLTVKLASPDGVERALERGKSYHVTIVVYGLSDIQVYASLTAWEEGEEIARLNEDPFDEEIDDDDDTEPSLTEEKNFDENGVADLTKFVVTDEDNATYDAESFTLQVAADGEFGIELSAADADEVSGQELSITFAEPAQAKIVVFYADETFTEFAMEEASSILNVPIESKNIAKIQILLSEAGTLTLTGVTVNAESTQP